MDYCWAFEQMATGDYNHKKKGLCSADFIDLKTAKTTRRIAAVRYGANKGDKVALNFCPFCGADYTKLGRI